MVGDFSYYFLFLVYSFYDTYDIIVMYKVGEFVTSLFFQIASVFYIVLIMMIYFNKKKLKTLENRIYSSLIVDVLMTLIIDMASVYLAIVAPDNIFVTFLCKLYLVAILSWIILFTYYIFVISSKKNTGQIFMSDLENLSYFRKVFAIFLILFVLTGIIVMILPLSVYSNGLLMYSYGLGATISYSVAGVCIVFWFIILIANHKKMRNKKYWPVYAFLILATIGIYIQSTYPDILLVTAVAAFITALTYFTIENPDMKMIEQLNIAKDSAEKANSAKTDFLSNMSHEIRTPLNAIVGFSQALKEENLPENAQEEVNDILMSANSLLEIVNGILDISKIEANKLEIVNVEYSSKKLMKDVISLITARIGDKPLEFKTYIDESIPPVLHGDHVRIKQIIVNLLTNAVKYTKEGSIDFKVSTVIHDDICRMIISVEDTGIGIKQEDIGKLFTKFERFELEKNVTTEGTGLGLAITKSLVELMGGKIVVQSVYGKGSKFTVAIDQQIVHKTLEEAGLDVEIDGHIEPFNATGSKILVVDDNRINLKVAARLLKDYHINADLVLSGQDCIDKVLNGEKYDLILMDDMMPKMTGTQTLQNLKNIIGFNMPVIALTANAITGMKEKYIASGFNDYLAKPIDRNKLHSVLKRYLKTAKEQAVEIEDQAEPLEESVNNRNPEFLRNQGVDLDHGLELLGDMETYDMTLEEFIEESKTRLPKIEEYRLAKDMPNYAILVHAMKSDCKYLGFMKLADLSYQHELASKENNIDFVEEHYDELMNEVGKVLTIVKKYFGK